MSSTGYYGAAYDRHLEHQDNSTIGKMQQTYWVTKQQVIRKFKAKEDSCIVAADSELDSKLELFKNMHKTSTFLLRICEKFENLIFDLSSDEEQMARFLAKEGKLDKTRAGKMMIRVGKAQMISAQQRMGLRVPLVRLYQEVETFRYRAVSDTLGTVNKMEDARNEYRGALLWMKDVSQEMDPDSYKRLEKFRRVQAQVRKSKTRFDRLKIDCMQKVDMLAASRCNMFSHVLATYQQTLLQFWQKTSNQMESVMKDFKGYQYYEFNMLKELAEPSRQLADVTQQTDEEKRDDGKERRNEKKSRGKEKEKPDEVGKEPSLIELDNGSMSNLLEDDSEDMKRMGESIEKAREENAKLKEERKKKREAMRSNRKVSGGEGIQGGGTTGKDKAKEKDKSTVQDLLAYDDDDDESDDILLGKSTGGEGGDDDPLNLLSDLLSPADGNDMRRDVGNHKQQEDEFDKEWQAVFGGEGASLHPTATNTTTPTLAHPSPPTGLPGFMPSQLMMNTLDSQPAALGSQPLALGSQPVALGSQPAALGSQPAPMQSAAQPSSSSHNIKKQQSKGSGLVDKSMWFNMFADLDPLSNPDALGEEEEKVVEERNC